jgi:hypothetical protein
MPHCQICLTPVPDHANDCPVKTGEPVPGSDSPHQVTVQAMTRLGGLDMGQGLLAGSIASLAHSIEKAQQQPIGQRHDPAATELRIERLERELAGLQARVAKLERAP